MGAKMIVQIRFYDHSSCQQTDFEALKQLPDATYTLYGEVLGENENFLFIGVLVDNVEDLGVHDEGRGWVFRVFKQAIIEMKELTRK